MATENDEEIDVFGNSSEEEQDENVRCTGQMNSPSCKTVEGVLIRFVMSKRRQLIMIYSGYKLYQQAVIDVVGNDNKILHTEVMYYCRSPKCPKSRETINNHNHEGSPLENEVDIVVNKAVKFAMENPVASCRSIIAAATEGISDEVRYLIDTDNLRHRLYSLKSKLYPPGRTDPMNLTIPDVWRVHVDGSLFVMYDSGAATGQKRIVIMSSLFMMDKFSLSNSIAADGTFFSRPTGWRQIYAWHLRLQNTFVPAVVVFMGERTERAYTEMLGAIAEIIRQNFGREWTVKHVMTDFELAIRLAVRRQFGSSVIHLSCYFHYSYCLTKKLKKLKLKKKCNREPAFNQYIREFRVLPLLPVDHLLTAFADLTNFTLAHRIQFADVPRLSEFIDYMRQTWIGGVRSNGEVYLPMFPTIIWNHNASLMQDNPKSTSAVEAWHRTLNSELRKRVAHKYWSIHCVIRDELFAHSKSRYLRLFSVLDRSSQRRPTLQGIPVLQRAVNGFDSSEVHMSLAKVTEAAYSKRWNCPTSLRHTDQGPAGSPQHPTVSLNVLGINRNLAGRRRRWFNAPVFQVNTSVPPRSGGINQVQNNS